MSQENQQDLLISLLPALKILDQYDRGELLVSSRLQETYPFNYELALQLIDQVRNLLTQSGENVDLFGISNDESLRGIIEALYLSFDGAALYPALEDKAARLLYFVIKDHPFIDGNKRLATSFFAYYLELNGVGLNGHAKSIASLSLYIAQSDPDQFDNLIKIIINYIQSL
jgi:death-on-curing family protein